jgi:hypothetical protein
MLTNDPSITPEPDEPDDETTEAVNNDAVAEAATEVAAAEEIVHAHIDADAVAAVSGDGSEPLPEGPVEDPYDVPNEDEPDLDPGEAGDPPPDPSLPQDDGSDPDAD